jgi:hypothetical protein
VQANHYLTPGQDYKDRASDIIKKAQDAVRYKNLFSLLSLETLGY